MKITLVTPCLNAGPTIERTLRSIEIQDYPDLQYIICDGGSTDGTLDVIARYSHIVTHLVSEKDKNVANALNKGFARADGEIFCYLNADDAFTEGALAAVVERFKQEPELEVLCGGCRRVFADGTVLETSVPDRFLRTMALRNDVEQPSTFWRATAHRKAGPFDETYSLSFDWEYWNRLKASGATFGVSDQVLSIYYFSDDNLTSRAGMRVIQEMRRVTRRYGPYWGLVADLYYVIFKYFDMNGYYDVSFASLSPRRKRVFGLFLKAATTVFSPEIVYSYNWNWASRQVRNLKWYGSS